MRREHLKEHHLFHFNDPLLSSRLRTDPEGSESDQSDGMVWSEAGNMKFAAVLQ